MRFAWSMVARMFYGPSKARVLTGFALATWFALGAYISSNLIPLIDRVVPGDLSGTGPILAGGAIVALIGYLNA